MAERSRNDLAEPETEEHVSTSWRRFRQAVDGMNEAEESEDFQALVFDWAGRWPHAPISAGPR